MTQAFIDMANEMEKKCGDWQNLPDTESDKKLRDRIMTKILELISAEEIPQK